MRAPTPAAGKAPKPLPERELPVWAVKPGSVVQRDGPAPPGLAAPPGGSLLGVWRALKRKPRWLVPPDSPVAEGWPAARELPGVALTAAKPPAEPWVWGMVRERQPERRPPLGAAPAAGSGAGAVRLRPHLPAARRRRRCTRYTAPALRLPAPWPGQPGRSSRSLGKQRSSHAPLGFSREAGPGRSSPLAPCRRSTTNTEPGRVLA